MNKYRNKKTVIDGYTFDSQKEANHYFTLKMLQKYGDIQNLELQPKFEIIPQVKWNGKTLQKRYYISDFMYQQNGKTVVEDVKGIRTAAYTLKRQLFLIKYPDLIFREV